MYRIVGGNDNGHGLCGDRSMLRVRSIVTQSMERDIISCDVRLYCK